MKNASYAKCINKQHIHKYYIYICIHIYVHNTYIYAYIQYTYIYKYIDKYAYIYISMCVCGRVCVRMISWHVKITYMIIDVYPSIIIYPSFFSTTISNVSQSKHNIIRQRWSISMVHHNTLLFLGGELTTTAKRSRWSWKQSWNMWICGWT